MRISVPIFLLGLLLMWGTAGYVEQTLDINWFAVAVQTVVGAALMLVGVSYLNEGR